MFHFNIIFRARFRLDIFFQKAVELSVAHTFYLFNLILGYNVKKQGPNLKIKEILESFFAYERLFVRHCTWDTCEPMARWAALQVMHMTTPRLRLTHSGPGAPQSTHRVLPSPGSSTRLTSSACSVPCNVM